MATKKKNGRKKPRSAAQKAATKKLVALNKRKSKPKRRASPKRKTPKRKAAKRKSNKVKTRKPSVAKKKGILDNIPLIKSKMFKQAATGVGTAALGGAILTLVVPQLAAQPLVKPVLALAGGGAIGAIAQVLTQGGLSGLGLGSLGGGSGTSAVPTSQVGFA